MKLSFIFLPPIILPLNKPKRKIIATTTTTKIQTLIGQWMTRKDNQEKKKDNGDDGDDPDKDDDNDDDLDNEIKRKNLLT